MLLEGLVTYSNDESCCTRVYSSSLAVMSGVAEETGSVCVQLENYTETKHSEWHPKGVERMGITSCIGSLCEALSQPVWTRVVR